MPIRSFALVVATAFTAIALAGPKITVPGSPRTNSVSVGANLSLTITASTTNPPLSYQWSLDGVDLVDSTNRVLSLANIQTDSAGTYIARVSDASGDATPSKPFLVDVDPTFTKITSGPVLAPGNSGGVAWADFNNDGFLDLLVASNPITLFSNRLDGTFLRMPSAVLPGGNAVASAAFADYDNDGFIDLYIANNSPFLFHNVGGAKFVQVTTNVVGKSGNYGFGAWSDYDRDGNLDLFVSSGFTKAANTLFRNRGAGDFAKDTASIVSKDVPQFSEGAAWCDYDNDGWPDLFVANGRDYNNGGTPQKSFLYHNLGNGHLEKITNGVVATTLGGMASGIWGDYDNDGLLDLFVAGGGPNAFKDSLYHNEGDGTFAKVTRGSMVNDNGEGAGCAWGDFDNDGFQDLYVSNFQNQTPEKNALYRNHPNGNAWITVRCQGRVSNRSAIGTKVRIKATIRGKTVWQLREIASNGGYYSQTSLDACFGLGDATAIDQIRIEWPSGIVQTIDNPSPRQFLTIIEPSRIHADVAPGQSAIRLTVSGGRGFVYDLDRSIDLIVWEQIASVTNLNGSATYTNEIDPAGPRQMFRARER